jgi:predicted peptidase
MKKFLAAVLVLLMSVPGIQVIAAPAVEHGTLIEACVITEILDTWGETVTAVRLEYSDEIDCRSIEHYTGAIPRMTYSIVSDRNITNVYVNNSGKKDDIQLWGKYVFINLHIRNGDILAFRDQVTFNEDERYRIKQIVLGFQNTEIVTRTGKIIKPLHFRTSREIRTWVDNFKQVEYKNPVDGYALYLQLYVPAGYETKRANLSDLPLIVHYPSNDYSYHDYLGLYQGALYTHLDASIFSSEEAQKQHPAFVVSVGRPDRDNSWSELYENSKMQQEYIRDIKLLMQQYNIDPARVYAISLAGGSPAMWNTIIANPAFFAAQISTAYDPYHAYRNVATGNEKMEAILKAVPSWFFAGFTDDSGNGCLGPGDTRRKGERLLDISNIMNSRGNNLEIAYGSYGEQMWNGFLRGNTSKDLADAQVARAEMKGSNSLITLFIPGTLPLTNHWCWSAVYSNEGVRNWLFAQKR